MFKHFNSCIWSFRCIASLIWYCLWWFEWRWQTLDCGWSPFAVKLNVGYKLSDWRTEGLYLLLVLTGAQVHHFSLDISTFSRVLVIWNNYSCRPLPFLVSGLAMFGMAHNNTQCRPGRPGNLTIQSATSIPLWHSPTETLTRIPLHYNKTVVQS